LLPSVDATPWLYLERLERGFSGGAAFALRLLALWASAGAAPSALAVELAGGFSYSICFSSSYPRT